MYILKILSIFIIGIMCGAIINLCIYQILKDRLMLNECSYSIKPYNQPDTNNIVSNTSFIFFKGKSRCNKKSIFLKQTLIKLFTATLYVLLYNRFSFSLGFFKYIVLTSFLLVIGIIDFETTDVYFKISLLGSISGIFFVILLKLQGHFIMTYIWGSIFAGGLIAILVLITGAVGWGDVEICFLCGLFLGLKYSILMIVITFIIGGVVGLVLVLTRIKSKKDIIPFGPFIAIATFITVLWGERLLNWYGFVVLPM